MFLGMLCHLKVRHPSEYEKYLGQKEKFLKVKEKFKGKLRRKKSSQSDFVNI